MLRINIDSTSTSASTIEYNKIARGTVGDLPGKLSRRITEVIEPLRSNGVYLLEYKKERIILTSKDRDYVGNTILPPLKKAIQLLAWYLISHIVEMTPGVLGGEHRCTECNTAQLLDTDDKCQFTGCPSHKKWAEVIDDYESPKDVFRRAWVGIPKSGIICKKEQV